MDFHSCSQNNSDLCLWLELFKGFLSATKNVLGSKVRLFDALMICCVATPFKAGFLLSSNINFFGVQVHDVFREGFPSTVLAFRQILEQIVTASYPIFPVFYPKPTFFGCGDGTYCVG